MDGLGIATIEQLLKLPRSVFASRFGGMLLTRVDQALGHIAEPLEALIYQAPVQAKMEFDGAIDSVETLHVVFEKLIHRLIAQLHRLSCGARQIEVHFHRLHQPTLYKTVLLSRASRNVENILRLFRCMLETVCTESGFTGIALFVPLFELLTDEQITMHEQQSHSEKEQLDHLIEKISVRLGNHAVNHAELLQSHLPEKTYRWKPVTDMQMKDIDHRASPADENDSASTQSLLQRPLYLLPMPQEIRVMMKAAGRVGVLARRFAAVISEGNDDWIQPPSSFTFKGQVKRIAVYTGPERIAGVWWEGHHKTRDYFDVTDEQGARYWIFRVLQNSKWYLHGMFA